jgi:predicted TIM-barrel fold metal-dependent hydrolase
MTDKTQGIEIVDAHHHIWDLEQNYHPWLRDEPMIPFRYGSYSPIRRTYLPADYRRDSRRFRVIRTVYVEAEWDPRDPIGETRFVHERARADGLPNAVVAQAWLDRADCEEVLAKQASFPLVRSIRHKPRAARSPADARRGEPGSMDDPRWRQGFERLGRLGLRFDLQTNWWHLEAAAELARDFPAIPIILNHTGLPADRSPEGLAGWRRGLERLAGAANAAIKISGLGVPGRPWTADLNRAVVLDAIAIFGAERAMFASNFPVDSLVGTFDQIFDGFLAITEHLPAADRNRLFRDNAIRIYGL